MFSKSSGGPYTDGGRTATKGQAAKTISGLDKNGEYFFVITSETNSHPDNENAVVSEKSAEVSISFGTNTPPTQPGSLWVYGGMTDISDWCIWI